MVSTHNLRLDYEDLNEVSNLNSNYLSGKYPDSFIWVYCVQIRILRRICCCSTKPEVTLLERLVAWDQKVEWEHLFQTILKWFRRKNNLRGPQTTRTAPKAYLVRKYIYLVRHLAIVETRLKSWKRRTAENYSRSIVMLLTWNRLHFSWSYWLLKILLLPYTCDGIKGAVLTASTKKENGNAAFRSR